MLKDMQEKRPDGQYGIPKMSTLDPDGDAYVWDDHELKERVVVWVMRGTDQDGGHRFSGWIKLMSVAIRKSDKHTASGLLWQRTVDDRSLISTESLIRASGESWEKFMRHVSTVGPYGT